MPHGPWGQSRWPCVERVPEGAEGPALQRAVALCPAQPAKTEPCERRARNVRAPPPPLCDIPSGCCSFMGPWTVTRSSLRMLRRGAAFCRPLRPVLLLVSFPRSRSPVVGVPGLCGMWRVPFARSRRPVVGAPGVVLVVVGVVRLLLLPMHLRSAVVRGAPPPPAAPTPCNQPSPKTCRQMCAAWRRRTPWGRSGTCEQRDYCPTLIHQEYFAPAACGQPMEAISSQIPKPVRRPGSANRHTSRAFMAPPDPPSLDATLWLFATLLSFGTACCCGCHKRSDSRRHRRAVGVRHQPPTVSRCLQMLPCPGCISLAVELRRRAYLGGRHQRSPPGHTRGGGGGFCAGGNMNLQILP